LPAEVLRVIQAPSLVKLSYRIRAGTPPAQRLEGANVAFRERFLALVGRGHTPRGPHHSRSRNRLHLVIVPAISA